jgi:iron(III) transport system permease protein
LSGIAARQLARPIGTLREAALAIAGGARMPVLAVKAYNEFVSELGGNPQMQTIMSTILVLLGVAMLAIQKLWVERRQYQMESGRAPAPIA